MARKKNTEKKTFKLDIMEVISALDYQDRDYYKNLPEEGKKAVAMQEVALRWLSAVGKTQVDFDEARRQGRKKGDGKGPWPSSVADTDLTEYYLIMTNEGPNVSFGFHELYGHEELEWMLLSLVGAGTKQEHVWIPASPKSTTPTIDAMLRKKHPLANTKEIKMLKDMMLSEEIIDMVKEYGNPDKLSKGEAAKLKQVHGGVFDVKTVEAELKRLGK